MGYVGNQSSNAYSSMVKQDITGNGGAVYTLSYAVANSNEIEVFVNNVRQEPTDAYSAVNTTLTMTGNVSASDNFYVVYIGKALQTVVPPDGSVGTAQLAASANLVATDVKNNFTKAQVPSTNTSSGLTLDFDTSENFFITLSSGSNTLATPSTEDGNVGQTGCIVFTQPSSGSAGTVSLSTDYKTIGGSGLTLSSANSAIDVVPYIIKANNVILLGAPQLGFA